MRVRERTLQRKKGQQRYVVVEEERAPAVLLPAQCEVRNVTVCVVKADRRWYVCGMYSDAEQM